MVLAHRFAYEAEHGPLPDGVAVMHDCDTPACVRVAHLRAATQAWNLFERSAKGRTAKGERNGRAKLNRSAVSDIRLSYESGRSISDLARVYEVSRPTIRAIVNGKAWR